MIADATAGDLIVAKTVPSSTSTRDSIAWSPDGRRMAIAAELAGKRALYIVDTADGQATTLAIDYVELEVYWRTAGRPRADVPREARRSDPSTWPRWTGPTGRSSRWPMAIARASGRRLDTGRAALRLPPIDWRCRPDLDLRRGRDHWSDDHRPDWVRSVVQRRHADRGLQRRRAFVGLRGSHRQWAMRPGWRGSPDARARHTDDPAVVTRRPMVDRAPKVGRPRHSGSRDRDLAAAIVGLRWCRVHGSAQRPEQSGARVVPEGTARNARLAGPNLR